MHGAPPTDDTIFAYNYNNLHDRDDGAGHAVAEYCLLNAPAGTHRRPPLNFALRGLNSVMAPGRCCGLFQYALRKNVVQFSSMP